MAATQSPLTGDFWDGPFVGLQYKTNSYTGIVDEQGKFSFRAGEVITFSISNLTIGSATGAASLTLADLDGGSDKDLSRPVTINRARFVLSLSDQRDFRSGVTISKAIADTISKHGDGISFDCDVDSFEKAESVRAVFNQLNLRFRGVAEVRNHLRRSISGIKALRDVQVPTRDGSWLGADVFHPIGNGPWPVLMNLSVYGRAFRFGAIYNDHDFQVSEEREDGWHQNKRDDIPPIFKATEVGFRPNASAWVPRGYVMIRVDSRGIGHTPGHVNPFSMQETLDYYDAIEWAAKQPWSDGNVGLFGASYHATNQWNVANLHPPSLKAMAPLASDSDAYRDLSYPGGIYIGNYRKYWWDVLVARNPKSGAVDFLEGLEQHPFDDEHYHGKGLLTADFSKIDIPVLTTVSQTETIHSRAGFEAFRALSSASKHLLVWDAFYVPSMIDDSDADLHTFFDQHLKGIKPTRELPPVRMMMRTGDSKFEWRDELDWPVPNTEYRNLFLDANSTNTVGRLNTVKPGSECFVEYSADATNPADQSPPLAAFETEPLDKDLDFAGHFKATIWVASTSTDADVFVSLRVLDGEREVQYRTLVPDSFQNDPQEKGRRAIPPMTVGVLKASRRALDPARSTADRPWHTHREQDVQPLTPNEPVKLDIELFATTGRIPAGWRLRVEISAVEGLGRLPGFERAYDESYHGGAVNRIFTGGEHASSITIPVVAPKGNNR